MTNTPKVVHGTVAGIEVEMTVANSETINDIWIRDDLDWFKTNPGRHHRYRLVMEGETDGHPGTRQPAVLVHRSADGDMVHLYTEEMTLPSDPAFGEAFLALAFCAVVQKATPLPMA